MKNETQNQIKQIKQQLTKLNKNTIINLLSYELEQQYKRIIELQKEDNAFYSAKLITEGLIRNLAQETKHEAKIINLRLEILQD